MRRRLQFGGLALIVASFACGCGGGENKAASSTATNTESTRASTTTSTSTASSTFSGGAAPVDGCKLSEGDVSSIIGFTVKKRDGSNESNCIYAAPDPFGPTGPPGGGGNSGSAGVQVQVASFSGGAAEAKVVADQIARGIGVSAVEVAGVGDKAFFIDPPNELTGLLVFSGTSQISVSIDTSEEDTTPRNDQLVALGKQLLS